MRIPGALALLIMVAGCTPAFDISGREWTKPGISTQQVTLDETECARQAFAAGWTPDLILGGLLDVGRLAVQNSVQAGTYRGCMTDLKYERKDG